MPTLFLQPLRRPAAAALLAMTLAGCSFSWGEKGASDISIAGRSPASLVEGATAAEPGATMTPEQAKAEEKGLRRIAILPVAWSDATGGSPCDLCAPDVAMKESDALTARLATGFLYEAVARHPRILFPPHQAVENASGRGMRQAAAILAGQGQADAVIVAAILELRPRVGSDDAPEKPAGAAVYMALVDSRSGAVLWSKTYDRDEPTRSWYRQALDRLWGDRPQRWHTAQSFTEVAIDELVEDLVDDMED